MRGVKHHKENEEVVIESRHEAQRLYKKQIIYYTISRAFISIPSIIVSYSFPTPFVAKRKEEKTPNNTLRNPNP